MQPHYPIELFLTDSAIKLEETLYASSKASLYSPTFKELNSQQAHP